MNKMMTDKQIETVIDNVKALCYGQELLNEDGELLNFVEITFEDERKNAVGVDFETFSDFNVYIEPKNERELELEKKLANALDEIGKLNYELAQPKIETYTHSDRKPRVVFSNEKEEEVKNWYISEKLTNGNCNVKDVADKFNISSNYASKILNKYGVRYTKKRKQNPTND